MRSSGAVTGVQRHHVEERGIRRMKAREDNGVAAAAAAEEEEEEDERERE